jgi:uncharacterized protein YcaQ
MRAARLSLPQARRIALAAQGFGARARRPARVDRRHLHRVLGRVHLLQLDSVNVVVRSHYLPLFSRVGAYARDLIDREAYTRRALFEYWAHEASLLPVTLQPLLRWRMTEGRAWGRMSVMAREKPAYVQAVLDEVTERGPIAASELSEPGTRRGPWWGWGDGKATLEWLFWTGRVAVAERRNFERRYDLPERVLPADVLDAPTPPVEDAQRELLALAARALGVATAADLADYFRMRVPAARPRLAELVEAGVLEPVEVEGWSARAYRHVDAELPRAIDARALLSPFDSLVFARSRVERLFGFRLRLEFYVPPGQRVHGYYVVPFLLGDRLVARVDLKADRRRQVLLVPGAFAEPDVPAAEVLSALAAELRALAAWLGLDDLEVGRAGDLARPLGECLAPGGRCS